MIVSGVASSTTMVSTTIAEGGTCFCAGRFTAARLAPAMGRFVAFFVADLDGLRALLRLAE